MTVNGRTLVEESRLRVCHVTTMDYVAAFVIRGELEGLREIGFEVHIVVPRGRYSAQLRDAGFGVHEVAIPRTIRPLGILRAYFRLHRLFGMQRFDVVHTHQAVSGFIGRIAARKAGIPVVVHTEHGLPMYAGQRRTAFQAYRWASRFAGRFCDVILSENREDMRNLLDWGIGTPEKVAYQGTGIDISAAEKQRLGVNRAEIRRELELPASEFIFIMAARFEPVKNHEFLFRALQSEWFTRSSAVCVLAGTGKLLKRFRQIARRMPSGKRIRFLGFRDDLQRLLPAFDAFVLTSKKEGVPHVVQEALLAGLPVVATNVLGTREAVRPGENGFLVAPGDLQSLVASLKALECDVELRRRLGVWGRTDALKRFGIDNVTRRLARVYTEQARLSSRRRSPEAR